MQVKINEKDPMLFRKRLAKDLRGRTIIINKPLACKNEILIQLLQV